MLTQGMSTLNMAVGDPDSTTIVHKLQPQFLDPRLAGEAMTMAASPSPEWEGELVREYIKEKGVLSYFYRYLPLGNVLKFDLKCMAMSLGYLLDQFPPFELTPFREIIAIMSQMLVQDVDLGITISNPDAWMLDKPRYTVDRFLHDLGRAQRIVVVTGAGILTLVGIPDFRSMEGVYLKIDHLKLSDPQDVFDIRIFRKDPRYFYAVAKLLLPDLDAYLVLHSFLKLLEDKEKLVRNYTQNIDDLEVAAGLLLLKLIQCHGLFHWARCLLCGARFHGKKIRQHIMVEQVPRCNACWGHTTYNDTRELSYGVVKPDITFFGESLPKRFFSHNKKDLLECDLFIAIGTSLKVLPVSDMVSKTSRHAKRILINRDPIPDMNFDLTLTGNCDDVATWISQKLGPEWDIPHPNYNRHQSLDVEDVNVFENIYAIHRTE